MKRLIVAAIILLFLLTESVQATEGPFNVYLPVVYSPAPAVFIDCGDIFGNLRECGSD